MNRDSAPGDADVPVVLGGVNAAVPPGDVENQTVRGTTPSSTVPVVTIPDGVEYVDSGADDGGAEYDELLAGLPFRYRAGLGQFEE